MSKLESKSNNSDIKNRMSRTESEESYDSTDSSIISDVDENTVIPDATSYDKRKEALKKSDKKEDIEKAENEYLKKVVYERINKYLKFDTVIKRIEKEHKNKIKEMKDKRTDLEEYIIEFLERIGKDTISLGSNKDKLTRVVTEKKSAIDLKIISEGLREGFENRNLLQDDEDKLNAVIAEFLERIDKKREVKVTKSIKRSIDKPKKEKQTKKNVNKNNKKTDTASTKSKNKNNKLKSV